MSDILLVEDNTELADLLTDFLRAEGYTVSAVDNGERAVELFEKYGAKLVVLDINLPGMNGFAVCSKLRENTVCSCKIAFKICTVLITEDRIFIIARPPCKAGVIAN